MRVREGDEVRLFSGDGVEWRAAVAVAGRGSVRLEVQEEVRRELAPAVVLQVWCALVRANRIEWAIEKCAEAGADEFRPIVSDHAARGDSASPARLERWRRIAVEAAEQSGRVFVPVVEAPLSFAEAIRRHRGTLVLADGTGEPLERLRPLLPAAGRVAVAVGPEGGWSDAERAVARAAGALFLRLGPHILRTETAAVVATAVLRDATR